jgi:hypothetical protein
MSFLKKIKIKEIITNNFLLKIISLILAVIVWLLMSGVITKGIPI